MTVENPKRIAVLGVTGFSGSYIAVELLRRGHTVIGITRSPEKFGQHPNYIPRKVDFDSADVLAVADKLKDVDILVNAYGPHSSGHQAVIYEPFIEVSRKIVLASKKAGVEYFVMVGGTCSLLMPGTEFTSALESQNFWLAYRRGIADSDAHVYYMEDRLGPVGTALREFRNARLAVKAGTATAEDEKVIKEYESKLTKQSDYALSFVKACRMSLMFFETNKSFKWTFVSPSALYRSGKATGSYTIHDDHLPVKGEGDDLTGRLLGITAADLAIAIADDIETRKNQWTHWTATADLSDDSRAPSYLTAADV